MVFDQYAACKPFYAKGSAPTHVVAQEDSDRLQSYDLFLGMYHNQPNTYKVLQRGQDSQPIYLPSPKKCIEACNRFLAVEFGYLVQSTDDAIRAHIDALFRKVFVREQFMIKFSSQKRYGLIRGDSFWHIVADETKGQEGEGERISIFELDPQHVFPIYVDNDIDKKIGYHLVDIIVDPNDPNKSKRIARRQTYRKTPQGRVTSELSYWETDKWDDRNLKPTDLKPAPIQPQDAHPPVELPEPISQLPVYQIKNSRMAGKGFGFSELYGFTGVFAAVNQAVSDEELALAFSGLGIYFTTAGPPKNDQGLIVPWELGPARVVEGSAGSAFERVSGVQSVQPSIDHMKFILNESQASLGIPDIAAGKVDVSVAESGISLQLQLAPLLSANEEKESTLLGVYDQMFFDLLHAWMVAFEGVQENVPAIVVAVVGDPMPKNRAADINEIISLVGANIITIEEARRILVRKFGYDSLADATGAITAEPILTQERLLAVARTDDEFLQRLSAELEGGTGQAGQSSGNGNSRVLP